MTNWFLRFRFYSWECAPRYFWLPDWILYPISRAYPILRNARNNAFVQSFYLLSSFCALVYVLLSNNFVGQPKLYYHLFPTQPMCQQYACVYQPPLLVRCWWGGTVSVTGLNLRVRQGSQIPLHTSDTVVLNGLLHSDGPSLMVYQNRCMFFAPRRSNHTVSLFWGKGCFPKSPFEKRNLQNCCALCTHSCKMKFDKRVKILRMFTIICKRMKGNEAPQCCDWQFATAMHTVQHWKFWVDETQRVILKNHPLKSNFVN